MSSQGSFWQLLGSLVQGVLRIRQGDQFVPGEIAHQNTVEFRDACAIAANQRGDLNLLRFRDLISQRCHGVGCCLNVERAKNE